MSSVDYDLLAEQQAWNAIGEGVISRLAGEINASGLPLNSFSQALESSRIVKAGAGTLFGFSGFNNKGSSQFIQVFDANGIPAEGAIPVMILSVATVTNFSASWVIPGRFFSRGIVICNSSTAATKTIGSADCWFDAQYV